jgi:hypothetical protein
MCVYIFVLISTRECFLANFIMSLRNIACITRPMKGVFSLSSLFLNVFFNHGLISNGLPRYVINVIIAAMLFFFIINGLNNMHGARSPRPRRPAHVRGV